jgi:hypothetical protein
MDGCRRIKAITLFTIQRSWQPPMGDIVHFAKLDFAQLGKIGAILSLLYLVLSIVTIMDSASSMEGDAHCCSHGGYWFSFGCQKIIRQRDFHYYLKTSVDYQ